MGKRIATRDVFYARCLKHLRHFTATCRKVEHPAGAVKTRQISLEQDLYFPEMRVLIILCMLAVIPLGAVFII